MDASRLRDLTPPEGEPSPGAGPALHG
jgi:hypothetical protein